MRVASAKPMQHQHDAQLKDNKSKDKNIQNRVLARPRRYQQDQSAIGHQVGDQIHEQDHAQHSMVGEKELDRRTVFTAESDQATGAYRVLAPGMVSLHAHLRSMETTKDSQSGKDCQRGPQRVDIGEQAMDSEEQ